MLMVVYSLSQLMFSEPNDIEPEKLYILGVYCRGAFIAAKRGACSGSWASCSDCKKEGFKCVFISMPEASKRCLFDTINQISQF